MIVTHDERIAATADRLISMRDGAFVDETRLTGGHRRARRARRAGGLRRGPGPARRSPRRRDLRRRPLEAALLLLADHGGHHHVTFGLALRDVAGDPSAHPGGHRRTRCRRTPGPAPPRARPMRATSRPNCASPTRRRPGHRQRAVPGRRRRP